MKRIAIYFLAAGLILALARPSFHLLYGQAANVASLFIGPASGTFTVGSTFTVSFYVNTANQFINAIDANILFPPDKLQVVSPSTGSSFIQIWIVQPTYSNTRGTLRFQGAVPPPGINMSAGLISTVTFRVKSVGTAILRFSDTSKVLLNDGLGTNVLGQMTSGIYNLILPPPAGPIVTSSSHPDQEKWYNSSNIVFEWAPVDTAISGYSYLLNGEPVDEPDDISEGVRINVVYKNVIDGRLYFHIKALREGRWGGTTHFGVNIDATPPAKFSVEISPRPRTTQGKPVISFFTTDDHSGMERYEIKIIPLSPQSAQIGQIEGIQPLFIEATSPFVPTLELGHYDVIVRAFDKAGNFTESKTRLEIVKAIFEFVSGEGLRIKGLATIPWIGLWLTVIAFALLPGFITWKARRWHRGVNGKLSAGVLNDPVIRERLKKLREKRKEYLKTLIVMLALGLSLAGATNFVSAQGAVPLAPPVVTAFSENISNEEIFYIGGKTEIPAEDVIVYVQNLQTGETFSEKTAADRNGNWFYSHQKFLTSGKYILWVQAKIENELSPPSPQMQLVVTPTAIQFGASRLSYETLYLLISLVLFGLIVGLIIFTIYHFYRGRRKRSVLLKEIHEAEESIRRGFIILRRDIEAELAIIHKMKLRGELAAERKSREEKLLKDLNFVQKYIGKEVWDIERAEQVGESE